jgi:heparan-alpha-glucosaminide N-acetyltransferase
MPGPMTQLPSGRVASVDAFRGLTFIVMLLVNYLAGASGIPHGIHHVAADVDGMGLADIVFPGFMFAVGMSIPFAVNSRLAKGDGLLQLQSHIAWRAFSLVVLGVFMVNMEAGHDAQAMGMPIATWSLAFYGAVLLVWGGYRVERAWTERILRGAGVAILLWLGAVYRGADGAGMSPQWWGILGLIGWAYLAASMLYQLARARLAPLLGAIALCAVLFGASRASGIGAQLAPHATHTAIVLCGIVCALLFFERRDGGAHGQRLLHGALFGAGLVLAGWLTHRMIPISKIGATPPWAFYCAAICTVLFGALYWLVEAGKIRRWAALVEPAAASPLVTYLIPFVLGAVMSLLQLQWRAPLTQGAGALAFACVFAGAVVLAVALLNRANVKLTL